MFGGYNWGGADPVTNYSGVINPSTVNYGGDDLPTTTQNFGGHSVAGGHGAVNYLLDLESECDPQDFGTGSIDVQLDSGALQAAAAARADISRFGNIVEVMEDYYSFANALTAVPRLQDYFNISPDEQGQIGGPKIEDIRRFLNPRTLETPGPQLVLGLADQTLENPPRAVDAGNRAKVITPAMLIEVFQRKDAFEPGERFHVRKNIVTCLTALADFQRQRHAPGGVDTTALIQRVQRCRLNASAQYQCSLGAVSALRSEAERQVHVQELKQRTLVRLQQAAAVQKYIQVYDQNDLQRPGNENALKMAHGLQIGGDAAMSKILSRLTLDQLADLVVEVNSEWRLPVKSALRDAVADYLAVPDRSVSSKEINITMQSVMDWSLGRADVLPDIAHLLACIPMLGRATMLEMDPQTKKVNEATLEYGQEFLLPSAIAKALKAQQRQLETQVAGLIRNREFYSTVYQDGKKISTALNLHGMYLQCSNPANKNMAFQTREQFNHPVYATRCASGLYVNVNLPARPLLECREGETLRLAYIDKLWSLFRVIVMDALETRLVGKLERDAQFQQETDPEIKRSMAHTILDTCVPDTFGGAAGDLTGITRNMLVNAAVEKARQPGPAADTTP